MNENPDISWYDRPMRWTQLAFVEADKIIITVPEIHDHEVIALELTQGAHDDL